MSAADIARHSGVGYNPAVEARYVSRDQADFVRSKKARYDYALDGTIDLIEEISAGL
jgi:sterol carrier protein 2